MVGGHVWSVRGQLYMSMETESYLRVRDYLVIEGLSSYLTKSARLSGCWCRLANLAIS